MYIETPKWLVDLIVSLASPTRDHVRVLEPACGRAPFLLAFAKRYGHHHELLGIDVDPEVVAKARQAVPWATILEADFLLWDAPVQFDIILGNPPYGIIGEAPHYPLSAFKERKPLYKQRFQTWRGKFNIYGAFIEHAVRLLAPRGKLVFVVPASWMLLDEFALLRQFLSQEGGLSVYCVGRPFPGRKVVAVVLVLEKGGKGLSLYEHWDAISPVVKKEVYQGEIIRFETPELLEFERSGIPLGQLVKIHFAPRSREVRSHPKVVSKPGDGLVPILTGRNLKPGWIDYWTCYSGLWMPLEEAPSLRPFFSFPHIVIGHTKGTQVVAAWDAWCYPWREEFHLVPKGPIDEEALLQYLLSELPQWYIGRLYRNLIPHLTKTLLSLLPIPKKLSPRGA